MKRMLTLSRISSATSFSVSLVAFALSVAACGSADDPVGQGSQPITGEEGDADSSENGATPDAEACALGAPQAEATDCQVVANGLCFATAEAACACDGCAVDACAIAESFPLQAFCQSGDPGSSDPDEPVSDDGESDSNGSSDSCGSPGGGTDPHPGGDACAEGVPRDANGSCDFVVDGLCFSSGDAACACAGCAAEACLVLESYPAQIRCATNE